MSRTCTICLGLALFAVAPMQFANAHSDDPWFARDKYLHGGVSAGLSLGGYSAAAAVTPDPVWRLCAGATFALTIGAGKELVDLRGSGDASWRDMSWNVMGTASGLLVAWLFDRYVF